MIQVLEPLTTFMKVRHKNKPRKNDELSRAKAGL
jgi:hypothetical protein